jgi:hypothetical protein
MSWPCFSRRSVGCFLGACTTTRTNSRPAVSPCIAISAFFFFSASSATFAVCLGFCWLALLITSVGCGGVASQPQTIQAPPAQDFSITLSTASLSVLQGGTSSPVNVSVAGQNGFAGTVQVTLSGLPTALQSNPSNPFSVAAGASTAVLFGAASSATTRNFTITAQGLSGSLSHSATLSLTVQTAVTSSLPRTAYVRTDATAALDDPPGEPHHRHLAYDPATKRVFLANRAINRVEVFSATDQTRIAQIDVPGATSVDLSPDGATLWVGSVTQEVVAIDTASLQVRSRYPIHPISLLPNTSFDRPRNFSSSTMAIASCVSASPAGAARFVESRHELA